MNEHRQHYRKNLRLTGYVVREGKELEFQLLDLSLGGMRAHFTENPALVVDQGVQVRVPGLQLLGFVIPARVARAPQGGFEVGFDFAALDGVEGNAYSYRADEEKG